MSFVVTNSKWEWLTRPTRIGESVGWTDGSKPAWEFSTRNGAEKARLMYGGAHVYDTMARHLHVVRDTG